MILEYPLAWKPSPLIAPAKKKRLTVFTVSRKIKVPATRLAYFPVRIFLTQYCNRSLNVASISNAGFQPVSRTRSSQSPC